MANVVFQPQKEITETILNREASIDIDEPLDYFIHGLNPPVIFRYDPGDPVARRIFLEGWYLSEADAEAGRNPIAQDISDTLGVWLYPDIPFPLQGDEEELTGIVAFTIPPTWPHLTWYGRISIEQMALVRTSIITIGDPKRADITSIESPRRHHRPTWEIH